MAYSLVWIHNTYNAPNYMEFQIDSESDLSSLPGLGPAAAGSKAYLADGTKVWRLSNSGVWTRSTSSSGGSGGGSSSGDDEYIWEDL